MAASKRDQAMIFFLLVLVPAFGVYYIYNNQYQVYKNMGVEIEELNGKIKAAQDAAPQLQKIQEEEARLNAALDSALARLPNKTDVTRLIEIIEEIASEAGIAPRRIEGKDISPASLDAGGIFNRHPIRLTGIKGLTPDVIAELLTRLHHYEKIFTTRRFTLTKELTGDKYSLELEIETYTSVEEAAAE